MVQQHKEDPHYQQQVYHKALWHNPQLRLYHLDLQQWQADPLTVTLVCTAVVLVCTEVVTGADMVRAVTGADMVQAVTGDMEAHYQDMEEWVEE